MINGSVTSNTEWGAYHWVNGATTIKSGVTVTVPANAVLFIDNGQSIYVESGASLNIDPTARVIYYDNSGGITSQDGSFVTSFVSQGSSMISLPVTTENVSVVDLWPTATSLPQRWNPQTSSYVTADEATVGKGYWASFGYQQGIPYSGTPVYSKAINVYNYLPSGSNWNLIGSISRSVQTSAIVQNPANIVTSYSFTYVPNQGYVPATVIDPGKAVWIQVSQNGTLTLSVTIPGQPAPTSPPNGTTIQDLNVTLQWGSVSGATKYHVQVATDYDFNELIYSNSLVTGASVQVSGLSEATTYFWHVRALNTDGAGNWSSLRWFSTYTPDPPADPCLTALVTSYEQLDQITVTDANGNSQSLYLDNSKRAHSPDILQNDELPPSPPPGFLDVRFDNGKFIQHVHPSQGKKRVPVHIKHAAFPVTVSWNIQNENNMVYWLRTGHGQNKIALTGSGSYTLSSVNNGDAIVETQAVDPCDLEQKTAILREYFGNNENKPDNYSIQQNMPNPFNPTTMINYQLPEDAHVVLKVYNTLGQEVATLVDEMQSSGYKTARFNANELPSGIYFYRIQAGTFSGIRKMLLIK